MLEFCGHNRVCESHFEFVTEDNAQYLRNIALNLCNGILVNCADVPTDFLSSAGGAILTFAQDSNISTAPAKNVVQSPISDLQWKPFAAFQLCVEWKTTSRAGWSVRRATWGFHLLLPALLPSYCYCYCTVPGWRSVAFLSAASMSITWHSHESRNVCQEWGMHTANHVFLFGRAGGRVREGVE